MSPQHWRDLRYWLAGQQSKRTLELRVGCSMARANVLIAERGAFGEVIDRMAEVRQHTRLSRNNKEPK